MHVILAVCMEDFNRLISHALQCLGCVTMTLKLEQSASVKSIYEGKDLFLQLPPGFGAISSTLSVDVKLGRFTDIY